MTARTTDRIKFRGTKKKYIDIKLHCLSLPVIDISGIFSLQNMRIPIHLGVHLFKYFWHCTVFLTATKFVQWPLAKRASWGCARATQSLEKGRLQNKNEIILSPTTLNPVLWLPGRRYSRNPYLCMDPLWYTLIFDIPPSPISD